MASASPVVLGAVGRRRGHTDTAGERPPRPPPRPHDPRFARNVGVIAAAGFILRFAYVLTHRHTGVSSDGFFYLFVANALAKGHGYVRPFGATPTAYHPPAWPAVLSLPSLLGIDGPLGHQLLACCIGVVTIVLVALAGREIAGSRVGVIAAAIAACYPNIWIWERQLSSETLLLPLIACVILLSYRFLARPRVLTIVALGAVCGLLALTHGEQILLFVLLVIPLALRASERSARRAGTFLGAAALAMLVVLTPWVAYNRDRFDEPVYTTTELGPTLWIANDNVAYSSAWIGSFDADRWKLGIIPNVDETVTDRNTRSEAVTYARKHAGRLPLVIAAREGRTWTVFNVAQQAARDRTWGHDPMWVYRAGILMYWLLLPCGVLGLVALRRRRRPLLPLLVPFVVVALATAVTYGQPRLRASAEVPLVLLAAAGIDAAARRFQRRARSSQFDAGPLLAEETKEAEEVGDRVGRPTRG